MRTRRTAGWVAVVALVVSGFAVATSAGAVSAPSAGSSGTTKADPGAWSVRAVAPGQYVVSWTSPTALPLTSDRPTVVGPSDLVLGATTVSADGRTVRVQVTSSTRPQASDFDVLLSGDRLDAAGDDRLRARAGGSAKSLDLPGTTTLPVDPATPGSFGVVTSDYELDPVKIDGMPEPIEMVGHVVEPAADAATGPRPLVLFLHGRHSVCYDPNDPSADGDWPCQAPLEEIPSQLGYDYVQQVLASQGYATVSVRVNGINAQDYRYDDGGADARAQIVEKHLDYWAARAGDHQLDLDHVVLVGHSRGGEGVDRASLEIPLSAPYRIAGQVLVAPTNFGIQTAAYVPAVTLLPYCDGDVSDLQGQKFTDVARDLAPGDTSFKSSVLVMGANHNYFNTEWTPDLAAAPAWDDWGDTSTDDCGSKNADRLSPTEQQSVGTAYIAGAVHLFASGEQDVLPMFDGSRVKVASTGDAQVLSSAIGGGRDVRAPGVTATRSLPVGASTRLCSSRVDQTKVSSCARGLNYGYVWPNWSEAYENAPAREFVEMDWDATGQSGGLRFDDPLDLTGNRLEARTIVDPSGGPADLAFRITDADGASALVDSATGVLPPIGGGQGTAKYWAQSLVADPSGATGVDLTRIVQVDLVSGTDQGRIWVADISAAPAELAPVPDRRLATVDLHSLKIDEGDGNGVDTVTASIPFDIVGQITAPATLIVSTTGQARGDKQRFTLDLVPGQTSGSIPVTYAPDRRDDYPRSITQVVAWATRNVMTDSYAASLTVRDDDPSPKLKIEPVRRTVHEGQSARWKISLSRGVDYDLFVIGKVSRGPAPLVSVGDVTATWLAQHLGVDADPDKPLAFYKPMLFQSMPAGARTTEVSIPIRRDGVAEGRESVTVQFKKFGHTYQRTVYVAPSA